MNAFGITRKRGAHFKHTVTDSDNTVKYLTTELIKVLCALLANVDPYSCHGPHCVGMNGARMAPGAICFNCSFTQVTQQCLSHLRACAILSTEEQHTHTLVC